MRITLATLPKATPQQVFDQVARHLLTQQKRSRNEGNAICLYRAGGGLSCAAGCLISDEEYNEANFEKRSWHGMVAQGFAPEEHEALILDLQDIHDTSHPLDWKQDLATLAKNHSFNTDVLNENYPINTLPGFGATGF